MVLGIEAVFFFKSTNNDYIKCDLNEFKQQNTSFLRTINNNHFKMLLIITLLLLVGLMLWLNHLRPILPVTKESKWQSDYKKVSNEKN